MSRAGRTLLFAILTFALGACATVPAPEPPIDERIGIEAALMRDITILASDEFGGRQPGTEGEAKTVEFIIGEMQAAGLTSGTNDPGSAWRAPVELLQSTPLDSRIILRTGKGAITVPAESAAAYVGSGRALTDGLEVVFVGREADNVPADLIAGKIVVMLGEPGISPAKRDTLFDAKPAAIITIVADESAIANVRRAYGRNQITLAEETSNRLTAFVTNAAMASAFVDGEWAALLDQAESPGFVAQRLRATIAIDARTQQREFTSYNVIGLLPGAIPGSGAVLLLGHWDHLGECGTQESEDLICNGAVDNASGIAVLLELSRRLAASGPHDRDIYVLATSAEELGLLGARAFVEAPPMPLNTIVAAFNFDTSAIAPRGSPVGFVGEGRTALDGIIGQVMQETGRELGNREFAESFVRRQDGWALLEKGVPAVFLSTTFGSEITINPYLSAQYHRPGDEIEGIELGGAIDDLLLHEELVRRIASTTTYPAPQNDGQQ